MKTISSDYIKEIKYSMKQVREALKQIQESEAKLNDSMDWREYDKIQREGQDATLSMMQALEEAVRSTSIIGSSNGLYQTMKAHKVIEYDLRSSHK